MGIYVERKIDMKKKCAIAFLIIYCLFLCACSAHLDSEFTVKKHVKNFYPNVKFVRVESEDEDNKKYIFTNGEFEFMVSNVIARKDIVNRVTDKEFYSSLYVCELFAYMNDDVEQLCQKYDFDFYNIRGEYLSIEKQLELEKTTFVLDEYTSFSWTFYIQNGDDIERIEPFLTELDEMFSKYYPKQPSEKFDKDRRLRIFTNDNIIVFHDRSERRVDYFELYSTGNTTYFYDEWPHSFADVVDTAQKNYVKLIEEGKIKDDGFRIK